jgi:hypothetical protein
VRYANHSAFNTFQVVRLWPLTVETGVQSNVNACGICSTETDCGRFASELCGFLPTNDLTPWSTVLKTLTSHSTSQSFPPFVKTKRSLSCSQEPTTGPYTEPDESNPHLPPYFPRFHYNIISPFTPESTDLSLPFRFSDQNFGHISLLSHACYTSRPFHITWFNHPNSIWWSVQVMKLLIMQSSPVSYHFLPLRSKYSSQHPVLRHPQSMFFP